MTTATVGIESKDGSVEFGQVGDGHPNRLGPSLIKYCFREGLAQQKVNEIGTAKVASIKAYLNSAFRERSVRYAYLFKDNQWWVAEDSDSPLRPLVVNL